MKRDKKWWAKFTKEERSIIVYFEKVHGERFPYSRSPYLPEDTSCCQVCGEPYPGEDACNCNKEYSDLIMQGEGDYCANEDAKFERHRDMQRDADSNPPPEYEE